MKEIFDRASRKRQTVPNQVLNRLEETVVASERYSVRSHNIASELVKVAKLLVAAQPSFLNTMTKRQAANAVNKIMGDYTRGLYRDTSWRPIEAVFRRFRELNIDYDNLRAVYQKDDDGKLISKTWTFTITFENKRGRDQLLYGRIIASGAGSVDDPLKKYDVVAYVSS